MKLFGFLIIFSIICSNFAVYVFVNMADPEHPGRCVYEGIILSPGESRYPEGKCILVSCYGADGSGSIESCMGEADMSRCFVETYDPNPHGQYPHCCEKQIICAID
ncbi:complement inhibitor CirpT3-like [Musca autumnalis]|uniref:complement inhibitor CirpT3-like n=1 Tax=Musca autumnalis TaxID=221902 RepID=UPI003CE94374